jgi:hypothetical protein
MAKFYRTESFKGPLMRIAFAWQMFKLRESDGDYKPKYGCTLILAKDGDWSAIKGAVGEVVKGQWGEKGAEKFKAGLIRNPILPGDGKEGRNKETGDCHPGFGPTVDFIRVQAGVDRKPQMISPRLLPMLDEDDCPSGSWGYPVINAFAWNHPQNGDGISFGIDMFQLAKKAEGDDVLGGSGRADPNKFFEKIDTKDDASGGAKTAADLFG